MRLVAKTACAGVMPIRVQHFRQPEDEQKQVQQAAKENDPQQRRLQRITLAEQHPDRIALGYVDRVRVFRRRRDGQTPQQRVMVRWRGEPAPPENAAIRQP